MYPRADDLRFIMLLTRVLGAGYAARIECEECRRRYAQCPLSMDTVLGDTVLTVAPGARPGRARRARMPYGSS